MNNLSYFIVFFAAAIFVFGIILLFAKNLVHAVFSFLGILICIVALFILAQAEFVGVTQLLVYVGGILILILFGTMLTYNYSTEESIKFNFKNSTILVCVSLVGWFLYILFTPHFVASFGQTTLFVQPANAIPNIGFRLLTDYVFMFEISGILLLSSLIGALYITKSK